MSVSLKWFDLLPVSEAVGDPLLELLREQSLRGGEVRRLTAALAAAWGQDVELAPPGTPGRSFNEDWIAGVIRAVRRGDGASYHFLLSRRLRPEAASEVHFLCLRVALSL